MDPNHQDERYAINPALQPVAPSQTGGFTNWVKNHKLLVIIAIIIIIALLYWFFARGKKATTINVNTIPSGSTGSIPKANINVNRTVRSMM